MACRCECHWCSGRCPGLSRRFVHVVTAPHAGQDPGARDDDEHAVDEDVVEEQDEELMVMEAYTPIDPRAVVIHAQHARLTP